MTLDYGWYVQKKDDITSKETAARISRNRMWQVASDRLMHTMVFAVGRPSVYANLIAGRMNIKAGWETKLALLRVLPYITEDIRNYTAWLESLVVIGPAIAFVPARKLEYRGSAAKVTKDSPYEVCINGEKDFTPAIAFETTMKYVLPSVYDDVALLVDVLFDSYEGKRCVATKSPKEIAALCIQKENGKLFGKDLGAGRLDTAEAKFEFYYTLAEFFIGQYREKVKAEKLPTSSQHRLWYLANALTCIAALDGVIGPITFLDGEIGNTEELNKAKDTFSAAKVLLDFVSKLLDWSSMPYFDTILISGAGKWTMNVSIGFGQIAYEYTDRKDLTRNSLTLHQTRLGEHSADVLVPTTLGSACDPGFMRVQTGCNDIAGLFTQIVYFTNSGDGCAIDKQAFGTYKYSAKDTTGITFGSTFVESQFEEMKELEKLKELDAQYEALANWIQAKPMKLEYPAALLARDFKLPIDGTVVTFLCFPINANVTASSGAFMMRNPLGIGFALGLGNALSIVTSGKNVIKISDLDGYTPLPCDTKANAPWVAQ